MTSNANCGFFDLAEERFDFDVSLSPGSSKGDEEEDDEVFVGPISHKERCVNVGVETVVKARVSSGRSLGEEASWSPLSGERFEEICKEAHQLANQLEGGQEHPHNTGSSGTAPESKAKEDFVLDSGAKLGVFSKPVDAVLSPIKRETFCVQDSPMKQLPPAIQQRLLRANGATGSGGAPSSTKARVSSVSTSSPVRDAKAQTQPKMVLRGRAGVTCVGGVLPSKAAAPVGTRTSLSTRTRPGPDQDQTRTRPGPAEKTTRLPPPSKGNLASSRRSVGPTGRSSSRAAPGEDRLSDAASVGSDASDSSLNSSLHGRRRGLAPPSKSGPRPPSAVKAPPPQTRRAADKRNTSSSSSSVSSFNSSLSVSPTGIAKLNSSLNTSVSGPSGRAPASMSRLANPGAAAKNRKSLLTAPPPSRPSASVAGARRSVSAQGRRPSEAGRSAPGRPAPAPPPLLLQTPTKRALERTSSVPNVSSSPCARPAQPKLTALIAPTPTSLLRGPRRSEAVSSPDGPRLVKPKQLLPAGSVDSLPQKPVALAPELQTPSAGGPGSLQPKMSRPSALPTPVKRRMSSIPTLTPKSLARPGSSAHSQVGSSHCQAGLPASVTRRAGRWSPAQVKASRQPEVQLQPGPLLFPLEDELQPGPLLLEDEFQPGPLLLEDEFQPGPLLLEDELQPGPLLFPLEDGPEQPPTTAPQPDSQDPPSAVSQDPPEPGSGGALEGPRATQENQDPRAGSDALQENQDPRAGSDALQENQDPRAGSDALQENQDPRAGSDALQENQDPRAGMGTKTQEMNQVLLVDAPAPVERPVERLLIDLSNTPVLVKTAKSSAGQLIDLTSPLIKWSPEDKKKNAMDDAPLINLSF